MNDHGFDFSPIAWAPQPAAPIAGGQQNDAELIQASQRPLVIAREWSDVVSNQNFDRLSDEQRPLVAFVQSAEPSSLLVCIAKLRVLADPIIGMECGEWDDDVVSGRQVLAFLVHMTEGAA